jgi:phosphatidylethanolamine-binding protein (PEBP) family uncharacterized protein
VASAERAARAEKSEIPAAETGSVGGKPSSAEGKAGKDVKKHPPLELPTGKPEKGPTKAREAQVPTADLEVSIPGGALSAANTCEGGDHSPAFEWSGIPSGVSELALFVMSVQPVDGKLYFDWAIAGIDPSLGGLKAGEVPRGAVVGRSSDGQNKYSLCPEGTDSETYIVSLYAIPKDLSPKQGFDPLALRKQATSETQSIGLYSIGYTPG